MNYEDSLVENANAIALFRVLGEDIDENEQLVEDAYANLLGLEGDFSNSAARKGYWIERLESGDLSADEFAEEFLFLAENEPGNLTEAEVAYNEAAVPAARKSSDQVAEQLEAEGTDIGDLTPDQAREQMQSVTQAAASGGDPKSEAPVIDPPITINGTPTDDTILGNSQNNTITGGTGSDTLTGGEGADTLTGGTAANDFNDVANTFVFNSGDGVSATSGDTSSLIFGNGVDHITDLKSGTTNGILSNFGSVLAGTPNDTIAFGSSEFEASGANFDKLGTVTSVSDVTDATLSASSDSGFEDLFYVAGIWTEETNTFAAETGQAATSAANTDFLLFNTTQTGSGVDLTGISDIVLATYDFT